ENRSALRPDHLPLRMIVPVLFGKDFAPLVPTIDVVVADDVLGLEKRGGGGMPVGIDLVVARRDGTCGIFAVKDVDQALQHLRAVRGCLLAYFVAGAPQ